MTYIIVNSRDDINDFTTVINNYIQRGWTLQGGVSVTIAANGDRIYNQAMVKEH